MNGRPKRSVPRRDYKNLNSFGTTDSAVQFSFQENMDEDLLDLSLTPEEQDEFREEFVSSVVGPEQSSEHEREASGSKNLEVRTNKEETVDKCEDDDLELRVQLLEKKRDDLKKQQLKDRIRQLEEEVAEMSGNSKTKDTSEKKKPKKKSGEVSQLNIEKNNVTIKDLRKSKKLNKKVDEQLKFLGLDSGESDENGISAAKSISLGKLNKLSQKGFPDSDSHSNSNQKGKSCKKSVDRKKKIVTPVSDSDSSSSESDSDSDSSSSTSSDDSVKKRKVKKSAKKKKSGLVSKSTDKVKNPQFFPHNYLQFEYVNKDLKFKQLNFKQFVAGELEIISNFCKNKSEKEGRLRLLQKVSYFSSVYQWSAILDFYAAWLRQIEIGKKTWNDDPQVLESAVLTGNILPLEFRSSTTKSLKNQASKSSTW
ncbi:unnamed protein product [Mytilus edulis]|uniref:Uncharacterized protein n=1 Tax=Mytilus edulis TaxID=6550 RepID=A0A8S3UMI5_MYTED|nr:unnamed protein product [Mytilus edulis]